MVLGQRQILNSIYRYSNLQTNTHLGQQRRHQTVSRLFTESSLRRRKCASTRCDSRRVNECFIKGSWGWKTCCTMLNKAMPFKPNTFFPPWTLKCNFSYHISQATTSFGAFTHQDFFFFFSGAARELLRTWSSLPWSFFGYSTSPVAPLRSGEATQAVMLLLMLPSGSPLMSADCFGGIWKSFFFHCCICSVSMTAVQLYGKILQWNNRLQN